jgi:serine/threonine protein kinase
MSTDQHTIGHYELEQQLQRDVLSETWRAFDRQERHAVTLRLFHANVQTAPDFVTRFLTLTQPLLSLRHPNIVSVLDTQAQQGEGNNAMYLVTEFIEGPSLADYIQMTAQKGAFPKGDALVRLLKPIATAIDYANQQGILHGGITPGTILLDRSAPVEVPKLTDFGVYPLYNLRALPLGNIYYIAPELAQGYIGTNRSDIYSLGVILYELCTGVVPFQDDTASDVLMQHIHATPTAPSIFNPSIVPAMTAVLMRALAKDPTTRFASAMAMIVAVAKAYNIQVPEQANLSGPLSQDIRRQSSLSGISAIPVDPMNSPTYFSPRPQQLQPGTSFTPQTPSMSPIPATNNAFGTRASAEYKTVHVTPSPSYATTPLQPTGNIAPVLQPPPAQPSYTAPPPPLITAPPQKRRWRGWYRALIALLLVVLLGSALGVVYLFAPRTQTTVSMPIVGYTYFTSSGLLGQSGDRGIDDGLQLSLKNISPPPAGKSYYAWLLNDNDTLTTILPIPLGPLTITDGQVSLHYSGNAQHTNLLNNYSRFLITEEDTNTTPTDPSLDASTHRFYAAFSQKGHVTGANPQYSLLDHFRHLLAQDPKLATAGLKGGLDIWLFRNTQKILEWASSARDAQQQGDPNSINYARRQLVRILDYLDGSQYVSTDNIPSDLQLIQVDPTIAHVALLTVDPVKQVPTGYLRHIGTHLREIVQNTDATADQRALAVRIQQAIDNATIWLTAAHVDAETLIQMNKDQLTQPQATHLMNDLVDQASSAFLGQINPNTNQVKEGVVQINYSIHNLATFPIAACISSNTANPCGA